MKNIPYILFMDDDDAVRSVAIRVIDRLGYEVEGVVKGEDALALYKSRKSDGLRIDAVLLDMNIKNGLGGLETLVALREIDADLKAILASGYPAEWVTGNHPEHGFDELISKPFSMADLKVCLAKLIGPPTTD
jgi:CheY-like chemotaxis protein